MKASRERNYRRIVGVCVLASALGFIAFGILRGEAEIIFGKAVTVCMQCIGIG